MKINQTLVKNYEHPLKTMNKVRTSATVHPKLWKSTERHRSRGKPLWGHVSRAPSVPLGIWCLWFFCRRGVIEKVLGFWRLFNVFLEGSRRARGRQPNDNRKALRLLHVDRFPMQNWQNTALTGRPCMVSHFVFFVCFWSPNFPREI